MRKTAAALAALCALTLPQFAYATADEVVTNHGWVTIYSGPSTSSKPITRLQKDQSADLIKTYNQDWYQVEFNDKTGYITTDGSLTHVDSSDGDLLATDPPEDSNKSATSTPAPQQSVPSTSRVTSTANLPPGVTYDSSITPVAPVAASAAQKAQAVIQVAVSQMGTPYVWGTSKDRDEDSFDCSNFTAYVYHHALGYKMTNASQVQNTSVGWPIPKDQISVGSLMIFENGEHVGIYAGNGQIIQCGGGLAKVGYIPYTAGSYWYEHLTSVRQMF